MITVALAKGRLARKATELLEKCGLDALSPVDSLYAHKGELLVYDTDSIRTVFYYMHVERLKDSTLRMVDVAPELLLLK